MRKLASVRAISSINPIPNADAIECLTIDGWSVVAKKGEFQEGDLCVYFEIDSWVPNTIAPFLTKPGKSPAEFNGVPGERLRTIRLRGQISQGLALPLYAFGNTNLEEYCTSINFNDPTGIDVTEVLGVQKWERPLPAALVGLARGNFPTFIPKTDQDRIQNVWRNFEKSTEEFEVTEKMHGCSMTAYLKANEEMGDNIDIHFGVCSRNIDLEDEGGVSYWEAARKFKLEGVVRELYRRTGKEFALQGELCGPGINGNQYGFENLEFFLFDIYSITDKRYLTPNERWEIVRDFKIPEVPLMYWGQSLEGMTLESILKFAEGNSYFGSLLSKREGMVFKSLTSDKSFQVVSNAWLLGGGE